MTKQTPSIGDKIILPYDIEDINRIVCEVNGDTFTTEIDGVKETFGIDEDYEIIKINNDRLD